MSNQNGGGSWTQTDSMVAGGIAAVIGAAIVFWLAGQIGAVLLGHGWPESTPLDVVTVLFGVLLHPFQPRRAWPASEQAAIPPAIMYWLLLAAMVGAGAFIGYRVYLFFREGNFGGGFGGGRNGLGADKSTWANRGSLKSLVVSGPEKGRLVLGHAQKKLVAAEPRQSVIVMGPSQSGKTTGLAIPAILEWDGPVIATSVKTDLARDTLEWRKKTGKVWVYDPTQSTSLPASTWSPLDGARTWGGAKKIANWLISAGQSDKSGLNDAQFWYTAAGKLLAPHLFAAAANGYTMADVVRWIDTQEDFELRALLQATGVEEAIQAAEASWQREERARSSIYTTAEVVIEAYSDPTVLESANTSEIQPESFFDGGRHTLYVCAPGHEQSRLRPVFSTLLKQFITAAYEKSSAQGGHPMDPPLLIVLDEAANIAPLSDLDAIASTAAGHGIQLLTVWQDLSQIKARYADRAQTVVNNHRAKVVLSGISDTESLDYASRLIGSEEVKQVSYTTDAEGKKQRTESRGDKNLAPSDVLRRINPNEGVLVYGALLPSRLKLRPWYKNKVLTARAQGMAPVESAFPDGRFSSTGIVGIDVGTSAQPVTAVPTPAPARPPITSQSTTSWDDVDDLWNIPEGAQPPPQSALPPQPAAPPQSVPPQSSPPTAPPNGRPSRYAPPATGNGNEEVPPIEDLFDFSDFEHWDDHEAADAMAEMEQQHGGASAQSSPAQDEDEEVSRERFQSAMDEWLRMFPESQKQSEKTPEPKVDGWDDDLFAPPVATPMPEPTPPPVSEPAPQTSGVDPEYEEFLAWKRRKADTEETPTDVVDETGDADVDVDDNDATDESPLYGSISPKARYAVNNNGNGNGSAEHHEEEDDESEPSGETQPHRGRYYSGGSHLGGSVPPRTPPKK